MAAPADGSSRTIFNNALIEIVQNISYDKPVTYTFIEDKEDASIYQITAKNQEGKVLSDSLIRIECFAYDIFALEFTSWASPAKAKAITLLNSVSGRKRDLSWYDSSSFRKGDEYYLDPMGPLFLSRVLKMQKIAEGNTSAYTNLVAKKEKLALWIGSKRLPIPKEIKTAEEFIIFLCNNSKLLATCTYLSFSGANLSTIPSHFFQFFPNLEILDLSRNNLKKLPPAIFQGLHKLKILNLTENSIEEITASTFSQLTSLKTLTLTDNIITSISDDAFSTLAKLEELNLNMNPMETLPSGVFHGLGSLKKLSLYFCQKLRELPPKIFKDTTKLENLSVGLTRIREVPDSFVSHLPSLKINY